MSSILRASLVAGCATIAMAWPSFARAQSTEEPEVTSPEIVVTGSNLSGVALPTPVEVINRDAIEASGAATLTDLAVSIPANTNGEFNSFTFRQTSTLGTAQINLRGLGLGSTLVLINGRRTVLSATFADDGNNFVDINTIPVSLIERVDVLKTGASGIYGSDAVAGVVNFVTRSRFEGLEVEGGFQTTTNGNQEDLTLNAIAGMRVGNAHFVVAASYLDRSPLSFDERDFTAKGTERENSGRPGSFILTAPSPRAPFIGLPVGVPIPDPACATAGGSPQGVTGFCFDDTREVQQFVADERRLSFFGSMHVDLDADTKAYIEASYADNDASIRTFPSLPAAANSIVVPPNNPNNPFGVPVLFVGRPVGNEIVDGATRTASETWRVAIGGETGIGAGKLALGYIHAENRFSLSYSDTFAASLRAALAGTGAVPGEFFNVFGTTISTGSVNSDALVNSVLARPSVVYSSTTDVVDIGYDTPIGLADLAVAVGAQWRRNTGGFRTSAELKAPGTLTFSSPVPDFPSRGVEARAVFAEIGGELTKGVETQLALRYESYGGSTGDTVDPKAAVSFEVLPGLTLRGSAGTSFRAPNPLQLGGLSVQATPILNPCTNTRGPVSVRTSGNPDLEPEDSTSFGGGLSWRGSGLRAAVDYWNFDYRRIIARQSPDGIVAAAQCTTVGNRRVPVGPGITVNPATGQISSIDVNFVNSGRIETDGIDLTLGYTLPDRGIGRFDFDLSATLITRFDIQEVQGGPVVDGLGRRNVASFARSTPEWRGQAALGWQSGRHNARVALRYIGDYLDEATGNRVDDQLTVDVQYRLAIAGVIGRQTTVTLGAINLFDVDPPFVFDRGGYDPNVHDPRGRLVYVRLAQEF